MQNDSAFTMVHRDGKIYRKGVKLYPNLDRYKGEFIQGRREGIGLLTYASGPTTSSTATARLRPLISVVAPRTVASGTRARTSSGENTGKACSIS